MPPDPVNDGLVRILGHRAASALQEWADAGSRTLRLVSPEWTARGYTGAILVAVNVQTVGESDVKVIVKCCPAGSLEREPTAHRRAKAESSPAFYSQHLVDQVFDPHPAPGGELMMFQEIAGGTLEGVTLLKVPDSHRVECCEMVVRSILTEWNPSKIRSSEITVASYLRRELDGLQTTDSSLRALARQAGLLDPAVRWVRDGGQEGRVLPNPLCMLTDVDLGARIKFDAVYGPSHGDLHLENILIPKEYGQLDPRSFRLVDLSTFEPSAPITRDPVTLMLSVIAPDVSDLREDEREALLDFVLEPWATSPPRLTAITSSTLQTIYRTGNEEIKRMRLNDWHSQFLLSVQATALNFTTFSNIGERGRWWFLQLAGRAGAAFLRRHHAYRPQAEAMELRRPVQLPVSPAAFRGGSRRPAPAETALHADERRSLAQLMATLPSALLVAAYHDTIDVSGATTQPNWADPAAVVRALENDHASDPTGLALYRYVDRLAHAAGGAMGLALHRWSTGTGRRNRVDDDSLRSLCAESERSPLNLTAIGIPSGDRTSFDLPPGAVPRTDTTPRDRQISSGGPMSTDAALSLGVDQAPVVRRRRLVIMNVLPPKNPDFTGRDQLLNVLGATLRASSSVSVIPQALHGLGGVGKTQLATEFVYRNIEHYDLIWWVAAEDPARAKASLAELAVRLDLPTGQDVKQTVSLALEALSRSSHRWLLVYDNVDLPEDLKDLVPSAGGHVIITSRNNAAWASRGNAIEVDVFERAESIELLQRHGHNISTEDADRLADKLGDLPLALEQAAVWHSATGMPVPEYLEIFDKNVRDLLSEGKPSDYPETIFGILKVAVDKLRDKAQGAAELLELFAYLGSEPISVDLLRRGRHAALSAGLGAALERPIELGRIIRELRRHGLAQVQTAEGQRIQVHRLLQRVLREELQEERRDQSRRNAQRLLAAANPGYPDELSNWSVHAEIGPHIGAADLIHAPDFHGRNVVVDQIRFLFKFGDYEASRKLGEAALAQWSASDDEALGADRELALIAGRHLANTLRVLGEFSRSRELNTQTFEALRHSEIYGENHEHTLSTANSLGVDLRLIGDFAGALAIEEANVRRHLDVFGPEDESTWRAQNNLAVSQRHLGRYKEALLINKAIEEQWLRRYGINDPRTLFAAANHARDLYWTGQYQECLNVQRRSLGAYRDQLGPRHAEVLLATRTVTMALRKCGFHSDARDSARDNYHDHHAKFGPAHEHTLAATVTYANALRCCGEVTQARTSLREALDTYRQVFGPKHALTLAAAVNLAIALRAAGDHDEASNLDDQTYRALVAELGADHPYSLAAANGRAVAMARQGRVKEACELSGDTLQRARAVRGEDHPDTLAYALNAAFDLHADGKEDNARQLMETAIGKMRESLGHNHPDTRDAGRGERLETDIEPPAA